MSHHFSFVTLIPFPITGGHLWLYAKRREGEVCTGANASLPGQRGLCEGADSQQKDQHKVLY